MLVVGIVGPPACGKSSLASSMAITLGATLIDDPRDFGKDVEPSLTEVRGPVIITDPHFCIEAIRKFAEQRIKTIQPEADVVWLYFENDLEKCVKNAVLRSELDPHREFKPGDYDIKHFSNQYTYPEGVELLPIWQPDDCKTT